MHLSFDLIAGKEGFIRYKLIMMQVRALATMLAREYMKIYKT